MVINDRLRKHIPALKKVVEILEEKYPLVNVSPSETKETMLYRAGQISVTEHLRSLLEQFEEDEKNHVLSYKDS